jgi:hypothetical protein
VCQSSCPSLRGLVSLNKECLNKYLKSLGFTYYTRCCMNTDHVNLKTRPGSHPSPTGSPRSGESRLVVIIVLVSHCFPVILFLQFTSLRTCFPSNSALVLNIAMSFKNYSINTLNRRRSTRINTNSVVDLPQAQVTVAFNHGQVLHFLRPKNTVNFAQKHSFIPARNTSLVLPKPPPRRKLYTKPSVYVVCPFNYP